MIDFRGPIFTFIGIFFMVLFLSICFYIGLNRNDKVEKKYDILYIDTKKVNVDDTLSYVIVNGNKYKVK